MQTKHTGRGRDGQAEQDAIEALWAASSRREAERRRREIRALWYAHHMTMWEVHASLAEGHERRAMELLEPGEVR